jgi:hypothetical protein
VVVLYKYKYKSEKSPQNMLIIIIIIIIVVLVPLVIELLRRNILFYFIHCFNHVNFSVIASNKYSPFSLSLLR